MQFLVSEIPTLVRLGRAACGSRSPAGSAPRSASSASCATARPGSARTCSSSLGSALFTIVSAYGFHEFLVGGGNDRPDRPDADRGADRDRASASSVPARSSATGLSVRGLTTAATLWVVAAVGMACGAGYYWPAVGGDGADDRGARAAALPRASDDRADQAGGEPSDRRVARRPADRARCSRTVRRRAPRSS